MNFSLIPKMDTPAGACLTAANWQEAGIETLAYSLTSLLVKPGFEILMHIPDLKAYLGWQGKLVLDARIQSHLKEETLHLISPFDGQKIRHSLAEIEQLLARLQFDFLLLDQPLGQLTTVDPGAMISDEPAEQGRQGLVYTRQGLIDIKDKDYALDFARLEPDCGCPSCFQGLSRAYLHHLLANTPLLAQRWLIQHNLCTYGLMAKNLSN